MISPPFSSVTRPFSSVIPTFLMSSRPERNDSQRGSFRGVEGPAVRFPMVEIESPWTARKRERREVTIRRVPLVCRVCKPGTRPGTTSLALHAPSRSRQSLLPSVATRNTEALPVPTSRTGRDVRHPAVRKACERLQISVMAIRERELEKRAKTAFGNAASRVQRRISSLGSSIGPLWTKDHRLRHLPLP